MNARSRCGAAFTRFAGNKMVVATTVCRLVFEKRKRRLVIGLDSVYFVVPFLRGGECSPCV